MEYTNLGRTGLKVSHICLDTITYDTPNQGGVIKWQTIINLSSLIIVTA